MCILVTHLRQYIKRPYENDLNIYIHLIDMNNMMSQMIQPTVKISMKKNAKMLPKDTLLLNSVLNGQ